MNRFLALLIPLLFLFSFAFAAWKKVKIYDSFTEGVKVAVPLILSIFPYIVGVMMLCKLLEVSGLEERLTKWITPLFSFTGVPEEIAPLVLMKPLSGSGSVAVLTQILERHGVDSYIGKCACVAYGTADTIFYIGAVYFANVKRKKLTTAFFIAITTYLLSVIFACFLCQIL